MQPFFDEAKHEENRQYIETKWRSKRMTDAPESRQTERHTNTHERFSWVYFLE